MKRICALLLTFALLCMSVSAAAATTLKMGSKGEEVVRLQTRLIELGLLSGSADGNYGQNTKTAVSQFQSYLAKAGYDVSVDGIAGAQTQQYLQNDAVCDDVISLKVGDSGSSVTRLQTRLYDLSFLDGDIDGSFGEATRTAVLAFQQLMVNYGVEGIEATGVADSATQALLFSDLSAYDIVTPSSYDENDPLCLKAGHLYARSCILIDANTGEALFEKNADRQMYPASTTKIMTLMLALENLDLDATVTIPQSASDIPSDSSIVPLTVGEKMSVRDLLYGMMIRSGNDAANAVATLVSGSTQSFADLMNAKAGQLGLAGTHYANAHGYHDPNHYTTARDMAMLTRVALKNDQFRAIASSQRYTMAATQKRKELVVSRSYGILTSSSQYYYPYAFGIKTGYTSKAGYCFVGAAEKDGRTLIAVVFKCGRDKNNKWTDTRRLFEYGFAQE